MVLLQGLVGQILMVYQEVTGLQSPTSTNLYLSSVLETRHSDDVMFGTDLNMSWTRDVEGKCHTLALKNMKSSSNGHVLWERSEYLRFS